EMRSATCLALLLMNVHTYLSAQAQGETQSNVQAPITITLQDAMARAKALAPDFHAVLTEFGVAREERAISRASLLPSVSYNQEFIYTEPLPGDVPRFIANNGAHEYVAQGNAHQALSMIDLGTYRRSVALQEVARARAEIAVRGLMVTVVQEYYGFIVAQRK